MTLLTKLLAKFMTWVMRSKYFHIKQIKLNYKIQYPVNPMLNDGIEKKKLNLKLKKL